METIRDKKYYRPRNLGTRKSGHLIFPSKCHLWQRSTLRYNFWQREFDSEAEEEIRKRKRRLLRKFGDYEEYYD